MTFQGDNMMAVKRNNRSAALRILHEKGEMSRKKLAEYMQLTPAAITKIVAEMLGEGLLHEGDAVTSGSVGRREIPVALNVRCVCALGMLINTRQAILSAVWLDGSVIFSEEIPLPPRASADETVEMLTRRLLALAAEAGLERGSILGVGLAVRGVTSPDGRTVADSFGALREANYPICERVESRDEAGGSQFFLRCEYGIGASLSIDGKIWHGVTEQCAEIGHIPVGRRGGKPCSCGKSGCLETIASPTAIREDALALLSPDKTPVLWNLWRGKKPDQLSVDDVFRAAASGDDGAATIVDRAVIALGSAVKAVVYLVDPGKIVLNGRMFENEYYLSRLLSELREGVDSRHTVTVEKSRYNHQLEDKAAPLLAVQDFFDRGGIL